MKPPDCVVISEDDFLALLKTEVAKFGTQKAAADQWGISYQCIGSAIRKKRPPAPGILKAMNCKRRKKVVVEYLMQDEQ